MKSFFRALSFPTLVTLLSEPIPALADGVFRPTSFVVRFYKMGFVNTNTGSVFEILDSSNGVDVDLANPGNLNVLANNVRAVVPGSYNAVYSVIRNVYQLSGLDGNGCFVAAGNFTVGTVAGGWGYAAATNNPALAASPSNPAQLTENQFGGFPAPGSFGPVNPRVTASANNNVATLQSYLTTAANPTNINIGGGLATRERNLFIGTLPNGTVEITPSSRGRITFTVGTNNSGELAGGCQRFNFSNNIQWGMFVETE